MSLKKIAQNPELIGDLFGGMADSIACFIDDQDWFKNDSLIETIPYVKIITGISKKIVEIGDVEKAFNHAYALSYFLCFSQAVKRYKICLDKQKSKKVIKNKNVDLQFSLKKSELVDSEIFRYYSKKYDDLLTIFGISKKTKSTILNYIKLNLKIVFHELLEKKPDTYKKLCDELDRKSYLLKNEKLSIAKYYQNQKNLYLSPALGDEQGMTLQKVYIEPGYRIHKNSIKKERLHKDFVKSTFADPERTVVRIFMESKNKHYRTIHELLDDFIFSKSIKDEIQYPDTNTLLLLGYPGQGKTSCIRKLLFDLIKDDENPVLVYHLPLRTIENVTHFCNAPFEIIREYIKKENLSDDYAEKLLKEGIIILEGLDELAIQSDSNKKNIDEVVKELLRAQENREVKLIITARLGYVDAEQFIKKNLLIVQLKEFSTNQQIAWLTKYKEFHPECTIEAADIKRLNSFEHHLKELVNQPIILHMIVTAGIDVANNMNRAQLYRKLFDSLIEREWAGKNKQISVLNELDSEDLREIIQDVALAVFHSGRSYIQKKEIEELDAVKRHMIEKMKFDSMGGALKGVMISFYFQETEVQDKSDGNNYGVEFLHKSLSEYMAAEKIWREVKCFLDLKSTGKSYWIDTTKEALEKLSCLFASQALTFEVRNYIWEIMENDTDLDKVKLGDRLAFFLTELLQKEFLWNFNGEKNNFPIQQALHTFYGYWTILSKLGCSLQKSYLSEKNKSEFVFLLQHCLILSFPSPTLSYQYLEAAHFENENLRGAHLENANLRGAYLENADLREARLENACLKGAYLENANLRGAYLENADLREACLENACLEGACLTKARLEGVDLENADLREAFLTEARLEGAHLENADLREAHLENAFFKEAHLEGADLENACLKEAYLKEADLEMADLRGADLRGADLRGAHFEMAKLEMADLRGAHLEGVHIKGAHLEDAILEDCFIDYENFNNLKKVGVKTKGIHVVQDPIN